MAVKNVLLMGDERLRLTSKPIEKEKIKSREIQNLIQDLRDTAKLNPEGGNFVTVGLSAVQIGELVRAFVVISDMESKKDPHFDVYINPKIEIESTHLISNIESCLSTPGICGQVNRYDTVKVTCFDENGNKIRKKLTGDQAIFVQHEMDHLNGILWIDRVSDTKTISYC